jgi:FkbM family methyltransferase
LGETTLVLTDFAWSSFKGSADALKYARRDLPLLDQIVAMVPQRRVAIQAGGNLGVYPKRLAQSFDHVYTFEPAADLFSMLCANAPEPNITRMQAALGECHAFVDVARERRDGKTTPAHEGLTHIRGTGPIPTLRLDDFEFPVCDLLQLDLEGWELFALRGAVRLLRKCRPIVAVEINQSCEFAGVHPDDVRHFITLQRYEFVTRLSSDEVFRPLEWCP